MNYSTAYGTWKWFVVYQPLYDTAVAGISQLPISPILSKVLLIDPSGLCESTSGVDLFIALIYFISTQIFFFRIIKWLQVLKAIVTLHTEWLLSTKKNPDNLKDSSENNLQHSLHI